MDIETLKQKCKEYEIHEGRASFYNIALEIVEDHPLQASIIILATWNVSRFRFMVSNSQNLANLIDALKICQPLFESLKGNDFQRVDYDAIRPLITQIYSTFSAVKGVEYTGASKIMHILNTKLFVMWDGSIRNEYGYNETSNGYVDFLKHMQGMFKNIAWDVPDKTLAKTVDEYNYVTISVPELEKRRKK